MGDRKVLVVGGGGREHAIVEALSRSARVGEIFCAPGNAGIASLATCVPIKDTDIDGLLKFAQEKGVDLTVVGPEAALAVGIADRFRAAGLTIFGHTASASRIETSKEFAKELMGIAEKHNLGVGALQQFVDKIEAKMPALFDGYLKDGALVLEKIPSNGFQSVVIYLDLLNEISRNCCRFILFGK